MPKDDMTSRAAGLQSVEQNPEQDTQRKRLGGRAWIVTISIAAVVIVLAASFGVVIIQQNARNERAHAAAADLAAVSEAQSELAAANADYTSAVEAASADGTAYQEILAKTKSAGVFDEAAVQSYEATLAEFTAILSVESTTAGTKQSTASKLSPAEVTDAYSSGGEDYARMRAMLTGEANALIGAADDVNVIRAKLNSAREMIAEATAGLFAATTFTPEAVSAEFSLASAESLRAFSIAHSAVMVIDRNSPAQAALDVLTAYLDSHAAVRTSNETTAAERAAEEERIRQEQVGTITVATDFMIYQSYDQCILAPGISYTQTFDISNGQNHTTGPDPARTSEIWTYSIEGGTVSYYKCYAD